MSVHIVHFFAPVNEVTCNQARNVCLDAIKQGATDLRLHFSSQGGSTIYGFTLYSFLRSLPIPLTVHNLGNIESMAILVYLAGSRRLATSSSRFLAHALHWGFNEGQVDHSRLREFVSSLDNDLDRYVQIFNERTESADKPLDIRTCLSIKEEIISPRAAIESGIAHEITDAIVPTDAITWWVNP